MSNPFKYTTVAAMIFLLSNSALAKDNKDNIEILLKELNSQIKDLKSQVNESNSRINLLEKELQRKSNTETQVTKVSQGNTSGNSEISSTKPTENEKKWVSVGDVKGTIKIPGTNTSIGIGGYVKTDVIYNSVSAGNGRLGDQVLVPSQIPVGGAPGEHSQITFNAKESRLWFKSFTPSSWGDINTYVEMDFYGNPGTYTFVPRLRHAYGTLGNLLAGQTWSTFLNVAALADHLDLGISSGSVGQFHPMVRWTQPFKLSEIPMELQLAAEIPKSIIWVDQKFDPTSTVKSGSKDPNTDAYFTIPNSDRYPDLVARLNFNPEWGSLSLMGMGRQIRYTNSTGIVREEWGGSFGVAGKVKTFGLDNIRFMGHYGSSHARYMMINGTFADASIDSEGSFDLSTYFGGMLSYQHWWNKSWHSSLTYGIAQADYPAYVNPVLTHRAQDVHVNLLWSPITPAMLGVEYLYATRELIDGRDGDLNRVQFSAKYSF